MRILAIDYGRKRVGLAVSDPTGTLASPYQTVPNPGHRKLVPRIAAIALELGAQRVLVGIPRLADGTLGETARRVLAFAHALADQLPIPVTSLDESFTTAEARNRLADAAPKKRRSVQQEREFIDQVAAALLLEEYLENLPPEPEPLPPLPRSGKAP